MCFTSRSFLLVAFLVVSLLRPSQAWGFSGFDTFNAEDNSVFNMGFLSEGSGDSSTENSIAPKPESSVKPAQETVQFSANTDLGTSKSANTEEEWTRIKQEEDKTSFGEKPAWLKGDKGDPGTRGEKGECVKEVITEISSRSTCSCNMSALVNEYGDLLRGLKGDVGPRGPQGISGPPGPPGSGQYSRDSSYDTSSNLIDPSLTYMGARISPPGPPGPRGLPGHKGEKGAPGLAVRGEKGERGKRGKTGKPGIRGVSGVAGPVGPKGDDVRISDLKRLMVDNGIKGAKGEIGNVGLPGPPGPPGPVLHDSWSSDSRSRHFRGKMFDRMTGGDTVYIEGPPGPAGPKGEPGIPASATTGDGSSSLVTVVTDIEDLQQATLKHTEGTLAFVLSEQTLLVRNKNGWQYLTLGNLLTMSPGMTLEKENTGGDTAEPSAALVLPDSADNTRVITHNKKLRMAALNHPFTGDMLGLRGVDYECFRQSRRANLKGTFRAFLASRTQNLDSIVRLKDSKLPVVNLRDEILFNSWRDIFTGAGAPFAYPPKIYSFDGRNIFSDPTWSQKLVWHGADKNGVRNTDAFCDAWGSNAISRMGVASNLLRGKLLDQEKYSCNNHFLVLCMEVTPEDAAGRHRRQSGHSH